MGEKPRRKFERVIILEVRFQLATDTWSQSCGQPVALESRLCRGGSGPWGPGPNTTPETQSTLPRSPAEWATVPHTEALSQGSQRPALTGEGEPRGCLGWAEGQRTGPGPGTRSSAELRPGHGSQPSRAQPLPPSLALCDRGPGREPLHAVPQNATRPRPLPGLERTLSDPVSVTRGL